MGPDYEKYRPLVAEFDLTDEQKDELIDTVWSMMKSFVDASVGDDPLQLAVDQAERDAGRDSTNKVGSCQSQNNKEPEF